MTSTFTVVCVYNSEATLEKYLRPGLLRQTAPFELRLVDNRSHQFSCAADALNHGAEDVVTDYVLFVHQDVELLTPTFFEMASVYLSRLPQLGVAGVVGARRGDDATLLLGGCLQGDGDASGFGPTYDEPLAVQTVDEMLLIVPRAWFQQLKFDSRVCSAWDLYGVDYALSCAERGRQVVVLPLPVRHASWGKLRCAYFDSLASVQRKHPEVPIVHTTCGTWPRGRGAWRHWATHKSNAARKLLVKRLKGIVKQ